MNHHPEVSRAPRPHYTTTQSIAFLLLAFPLVTALAAMIKTSVNVPLTDDYGAITQFLLRYSHIHGWLARLGWVINAQHNEYKLMLLSATVAVQYHLIGHANYRALQLIGDLSVPATLWLLWLLLARQQRPFQQIIWLILIPWYLFLSLTYFEAVNWANTAIQELTIVPLAIACVLLFTSSTRRATLWGTLFLILSIASFASGFILAVALVVLLICQRRLRASLAVTLAAGIMGAIYSFHYASSPAGHPLPPLGGALAYTVVFLGSLFSTILPCSVLGILLVAGFIFLLTRGWARLSPDTFCIALFCVLTGIAVAPGRYYVGLQSAMAGRYRVYPLMLISAEYLAILRIFVPRRFVVRSGWGLALGLATVAAISFGITEQMNAYRMLHARQRLLLTHIILWERHPDRLVAAPDEPGYFYGSEQLDHRITSQQSLAESVASGLYLPPVSPQDPLPLQPHSEATQGIEGEPPARRN
jgi:hypothetical protein